MSGAQSAWFEAENVGDIPSPGVLVYPDRVDANVRRMLAMAGGPDRLRPHVKTHKLPELVRLQQQHGIQQFKAATLAEAEMLAACGARHVLLAYQPVGPNVRRLLAAIGRYPDTRFAALVDNAVTARTLSEAAQAQRRGIELLVDIDCGMQRTGIPAASAAELYRLLSQLPAVAVGGLHAYDGHIHDRDLATRSAEVRTAMAPVHALREALVWAGLSVPRLVAGGTPTFPIHARNRDVECSPGTCLLWDGWSADALPDLEFIPAAVVLTRVVSKPGPNRLCLDLGHKAIAAEMPPPRVHFPAVPDAVAVMHNEEHLVVSTARADVFAVGDALYGIPWHICPTMALHATATAVVGGRATASWRIVARDRT